MDLFKSGLEELVAVVGVGVGFDAGEPKNSPNNSEEADTLGAGAAEDGLSTGAAGFAGVGSPPIKSTSLGGGTDREVSREGDLSACCGAGFCSSFC